MVQRIAVGLDVHARSVIGHGIDQVTGEVFTKTMGCDPAGILGWVAGLPGPATVAYEAGPTGYGLARAFAAAGMDCVVAAPSKLLPAPGSRVKTDRRDAKHLAGLVAAGLVTPVRVPGVAEEAARDLVRARDQARGDLMRARHRLSKLLLRYGHVWRGKKAWTGPHRLWLEGIRLDDPVAQIVLDNDWMVVQQATTRRDLLDARIKALIPGSCWEPVVRALCCLRGVSELTAFGLAVEIGDWDRFTAPSLGSYLGLVPSERSSGGSRWQGGVTKTGNKYARRLLVEAAWHHRSAYRPAGSADLRRRWADATPGQVARADQANRRLHQQWVRFDARKKNPAVANAAVARQLAGFCWALVRSAA